ncbi:DSD1 family PLP-dependent enzyme [Winogradskya consettensis]|uniref:Alanine racemase n=1 Tax=Winogradskya consettensis TaxID=113560 RepID=A0A919SJL4_9ACTN|nr:alanine racemase [Actinoplanes consettensis]
MLDLSSRLAIVTTPRTPYLMLDRSVASANIARLRERIAGLGVRLRPHLKTTKSVDVARLVVGDVPGPITVSTLAEAFAFADAGYTDILYAVGIAPAKLPDVYALQARDVRLTVLLDSVAQAEAVAGSAPALIEIDCDGHRGGVLPGDPLLLDIAAALGAPAGVLVHAGESYHARSIPELEAAAENERAVAVEAATRLRAAGHECPIVSVGSTPTAHFARDLTGVTEVRAGNYVLFDLVMAGLGVCTPADIAAAVVVTVIGHNPGKGWIMTDGGWMATSRDRGTAAQPVDQGYGLVTALDGTIFPDLLMVDASQEHGTLALREGSAEKLPDLPVGTPLRILPNHACATTAQHDGYHVRDTPGGELTAYWPRVRGW